MEESCILSNKNLIQFGSTPETSLIYIFEKVDLLPILLHGGRSDH